MEGKENVCVETEAEQVAEAKEKEGSTAFGKFKDVNALVRAYEALEAEFTRRSQRLKELEKQADNFTGKGGKEAEKLLKTAAKRKERERAFDEFVSELESQATNGEVAEKPAFVPTESVEPSENENKQSGTATLAKLQAKESEIQVAVEQGEENAVGDRFVEKNQNIKSPSTVQVDDLDVLYQKASGNEGVRLRIVGDYLASIGGSGAPITKSGAGLLVTPPSRAKSITEAGGMALRFLEKGGRA